MLNPMNGMMNNPMFQQMNQMAQMIGTLRNSGNLTGAINSIAEQNPMMRQAKEMVEKNGPSNIEQAVKNVCKQKGIDFDQFMGQMNQMGINPRK